VHLLALPVVTRTHPPAAAVAQACGATWRSLSRWSCSRPRSSKPPPFLPAAYPTWPSSPAKVGECLTWCTSCVDRMLAADPMRLTYCLWRTNEHGRGLHKAPRLLLLPCGEKPQGIPRRVPACTPLHNSLPPHINQLPSPLSQPHLTLAQCIRLLPCGEKPQGIPRRVPACTPLHNSLFHINQLPSPLSQPHLTLAQCIRPLRSSYRHVHRRS